MAQRLPQLEVAEELDNGPIWPQTGMQDVILHDCTSVIRATATAGTAYEKPSRAERHQIVKPLPCCATARVERESGKDDTDES
jgi:hypothetical protein